MISVGGDDGTTVWAKAVNDGIGMAAYTMDSHNAQRAVVINGRTRAMYRYSGFGLYPISYRSIVPRSKRSRTAGAGFVYRPAILLMVLFVPELVYGAGAGM